jgi:23S rRNA (uracil1939-C5)-methyltransferase
MPLLDFYSGVGAIGLPLSHNRDELILLDSNADAIAYAKKNIELNKRSHTEAFCIPAEKMTDLITGDRQLLLDPPRAGLHPKVVSTILQKLPPRIVYMSCDLSTHARDIRLLSEAYRVNFLKLYNFFPRTPHIEAICVMDKL